MKRFIWMWATLIGFSLQVESVYAQVLINISDRNESLKTEPIDEVQFTVQYDMRWMPDTLRPDRLQDETMMLNVGTKRSVYYSYAKYLSDSIVRACREAGVSMSVIAEQVMRLQGRVSYKIYKNYPEGKVTTLDQVAANRFHCEEINERPQWEIHPDTAMILGYVCRRATARFKGRDYEAWFAADIPRSEGPWKLYGLPGLILKAADTRGHYRFACTGLVQSRGGETIRYGDQGYETVSRKQLNRQFERHAADPAAYAKAGNPHANLVFRNESGESVSLKNMPYNPIEREE